MSSFLHDTEKDLINILKIPPLPLNILHSLLPYPM